jgi:N-acetyl-anhydromuramyl-L-alanine amidase AmpD
MAQKSPLKVNQPTATKAPVAAADTLTFTLQSKFIQVDPDTSWHEGWPQGPMVKNATLELVPLGVKATSDARGKAVLDASNLKNGGSYTLKLTPAAANTWEEKKAGTYGSDTKMTARYRPVELTLKVSRNGATFAVDEVQVPATASKEVIVKATGRDIAIDWRPAWIASPNRKKRSPKAAVSVVVLHRTGEAPIGSPLNTFMGGGVTSAHYLLDTNGHFVNLVPETERAAHAGTSWWDGLDDLNDVSVGIEIVNKSGDFTDVQYEALIELLNGISNRHTDVTRHRIIAHSDVRVGNTSLALSSERGVCPGPNFEWSRLMDAGVSSMPDAELFKETELDTAYGSFFKNNPNGKLSNNQKDQGLVNPTTKKPYGIIQELQRDLSAIGYSINAKDGVTTTGIFDTATQAAVDRFRRHFMSGLVKLTNNVDPTFDRATAIALKRVVLDRDTE